ncbi:hypothetical protein E4U49_008072 [Claviceps purpurea]|nr:hypothetical protein E4U49_008072 [Claviceps purpurea]
MHEPAFDFEYEYIQGVERIERYRTGFCGACLHWEPSERPDISEALRSERMKRWALTLRPRKAWRERKEKGVEGQEGLEADKAPDIGMYMITQSSDMVSSHGSLYTVDDHYGISQGVPTSPSAGRFRIQCRDDCEDENKKCHVQRETGEA